MHEGEVTEMFMDVQQLYNIAAWPKNKQTDVSHPSAWGEYYSGLTQFEPFV